MAKTNEKKIAYEYYTIQGMTAKAISERIRVTEKTIGKWIDDGNWKAVRNANVNSSKSRVDNIKELISELTDQQLELVKEVKTAQANGDKDLVVALRQQSASMSQEVAIQTKALERMDAENKISLTIYLEVMTDIFKNMERDKKEMYLQTLDWQEQHLQTITLKLG